MHDTTCPIGIAMLHLAIIDSSDIFLPVCSPLCLAHRFDTSVSDVSLFWVFSQGSDVRSGRQCLRRQLAGRGAHPLFAKQKLFILGTLHAIWTLFVPRNTQLKPNDVYNQAETQTNSNNWIYNIIYKINRQQCLGQQGLMFRFIC